MIKKCKKKEIKCPECEEIVLKQSFLKHGTERGCLNIDPKLKMGNWDLENYLCQYDLLPFSDNKSFIVNFIVLWVN